MSIVLDSPAWTTADALDGLVEARYFRIRAEVRETEWLARLGADLNPYGHGIDPDLDRHFVIEDVACALGIPSATAAAKLHTAAQLVTRFRATLAAMHEARLDLRMATTLVDLAAHLPDPLLVTLQAEALTAVETKTLAQFAARLRRLVASADPRDADTRHQADRTERRVVFTPTDNGMTELWALLPTENAAALHAAVQTLADQGATVHQTHAPESVGVGEGDGEGDGRTADQRRADALCALATGGHGLRPNVNVTIPASVILGLDDQPCELSGPGGPHTLTAAIARALAADPSGSWRRILTDPAGSICDLTSTRYRPPAGMQRYIRLRDRTCRFPTCRRKADTCHLDHVHDHALGGPTHPANLIPLCSRHHHLKHDARWKIQRHPDGSITWTTPTGRVHRVAPPDPPPHSRE